MARLLNKASVVSIMNKRAKITEQHIGKKVLLTIMGNGTVVDVKNKAGEHVQSVVEPGTVFQTKIFNLQANSSIAMSNPLFKTLSAEGVAAEKAGNFTLASEKFTEFLNKTQISFNIPTSSSVTDKLVDRVDISARIIKITTENGSLLTIDPSTISIMAPELVSTTSFSFDEEEEDAPENSETPETVVAPEVLTA